MKSPPPRRPRVSRPPQMAKPSRRGTGGAFAVVGVALAALLVLALAVPPLVSDAFVGDAIVAFAADKDVMLRQSSVRSLIALRLEPGSASPVDPNGASRPFVVRRGDTVGTVAAALEAQGLVRSRLAFTLAVYDSGTAEAIQAGTYTLAPSMTPAEIAKVVERAPGEQVTLRVIEGWRRTEIAAAVAKTFRNISADDFLKAAVVGQRKDDFLAGLAPTVPLEGFLFPDTYFFRPTATVTEVVDALVATFADRAGPALAAVKARGMSAYDLVKLASIVEREARDRSESAQIAGVYSNRLAIGMKLDADPTIQYAKGGWGELALADLRLESPYNSYLVAGLPPTPICSPGLAALQGSGSPAKHGFLFFVAKGDAQGSHAFATTLTEHEANRVRFGNR
ncbi:MAG: endolytic transglycosylase MltG [Chloroflexi bacterium]|nr:endolytic transglycosylase MltG [Chloroflexota bacterium]